MTTIDQDSFDLADRARSQSSTAPGERIDGRVLRGLRNRRSLIDAYYALAGESGEAPKAADVAERAGVSVRSLFQHFRDLDDLRAAVVDEMCSRALEILMLEMDRVDASAPLSTKLDHVLQVRVVLWEMLKPMRQAHLLRDGIEDRVNTSEVLAQVRHVIRDHLRVGFADELSALDLDLELALSAFQAALSSSTWDHLRFVHGYDVDTTVAVMRHMALAVLGCRDDA